MGRTLVIGDIHGCIAPFRELVENVIRLERSDSLYLLGDYIDRGPGVSEVVNYILECREEGYNIFPIMGNHEYMLIRSFDDPAYFKLWHLNGCIPTLLSFGIDPEKVYDRESVRSIPESYLEFFSSLPLYLETEHFFFVHAGLTPGMESPDSDPEQLLWTRLEIYNDQVLKGRTLFHGHTPIALEAIRERVNNKDARIINLDGGCVYRNNSLLGNLVGLDTESRELFVVKNPRD